MAFVLFVPGMDHWLVGAVNFAQGEFLNTLRGSGGVPLDFEVVDDRGMVLISSDPTALGRLTEHMPVVASLIVQSHAGIVPHNVVSHPHYVAYTPLPGYPGWGVNVEQPRDVVLTLPHELQRRMLLFGFVIVTGMSLLAFLDVRSVIQPLTRLRDAAERIADGNLDHPVRVTAKMKSAHSPGPLRRCGPPSRRRGRKSRRGTVSWRTASPTGPERSRRWPRRMPACLPWPGGRSAIWRPRSIC
ncbi:MAG TPA: HAMP domain-containing protein [bacterium]|nr:HAMP domain-containing protein [bacterium]